jgi:hypothetical protein
VKMGFSLPARLISFHFVSSAASRGRSSGFLPGRGRG